MTANDPGMICVKHAGQGVVIEVDADQLFGIVAEYRASLRGVTDGFVDLRYAGVTVGNKSKIHQRHVDGWNPDGQAVEFSVQVRDHFADGSSSAGLCGNHRLGG